MPNNNSWNSMHLVKDYLQVKALQKPEQTIFELVSDRLPDWRMLDIGIGLGRTTRHFAPHVKEYTGIDYSSKMVATCIELFREIPENVSIRLGDARQLQAYDTDHFDFVLFSYNGLDYVSHDDRLQALGEIRRVLKPGGLFVFSSHNLRYIDKLYRIRHNNSPRYFAYQCYRYVRLILTNGFPGRYKALDRAVINDGAHHFSLLTYYIRPAVQLEQLTAAGFGNFSLYGLKTGEQIDLSRLDEVTNDSWIYYVCSA